jgi:peroxiredoxin
LNLQQRGIWWVLLASVWGAAGIGGICQADEVVTPAGPSLGRVAHFSLADTTGQIHTPQAWQKSKAVVLLFLAIDCPVSNGYAPEMTRLATAFGQRDVWFAGVHCDTDVTAEIAAKHAAEYRLPFPVLLDPRQELAGQAKAKVTPEAVVLLPDGQIVYRGRLDDRYSTPGKRRAEPSTRDLAAALEAVLNGDSPAVAETKAYGCPLPPLESQPAGAPAAQSTPDTK